MFLKINFHVGAGLFSYYSILLENLVSWDEDGTICKKDVVYVDALGNARKNKGLGHIGFNVFDVLLDQTARKSYDKVLVTSKVPIPSREYFLKRVDKYKSISSKYLKLSQTLIDRCMTFMSREFEDGKTLGVHVRMTDMNKSHKELGTVTFHEYTETIKEILAKENVNKIFVSSDNMESIKKLVNIYGKKIVYIDSPYRSHAESTSSTKRQELLKNGNIYKREFFEDSVLDAFLLSMCDITCGRISWFNWCSQTFEFTKNNKYFHIGKL